MLKQKIQDFIEYVEKIKKDNISKILSFLEWFKEKLDLEFKGKNIYKGKISQFSIFLANLGENIGSEISKNRPVLILSSTGYSSVGKDILIVGITDFYDEKGKNKKLYEFDIVISNYKKYGLNKKSIIRLSTIRQIDKKRLVYKIGKLDNELRIDIKNKFYNLFKFK